MKLKTYTAETMAQALAQVRKDLGKNAMILHTRSYRVGAWFGLGGRNMVEITASSPSFTDQPRAPRAMPRVATPPPARHVEPKPAPPPSRAPAPLATQGQGAPEPEIVIQRGRTITRQRLAPVGAMRNHADASGGPTPTPTLTPNPSPSRSNADDAETGRPGNDEDPSGLDGRNALFADDAPRSVNRMAQADPVPTGRVQRPLVSVMATRSVANHHDQSPLPAPPQSQPASLPASPEPKPTKSETELRAQLESMQKLMGQVLESTRKTAVAVGTGNAQGALPSGEMPAPLFALYSKMMDNDVPVDVADRLVGLVRDRLDTVELRDPQIVRPALLRAIESTIRTRSESLLTLDHRSSTARPRVIALIGPTGVGKTTTVAKLAATYKLRHGKAVGLITSDTYRIAAVAQLKTYAEIIDLPLKIANTPQEMTQAIEELGACDIVVIDTAGRSQNDQRRLDELALFTEAAAPDETHLVLSTTVGDNVLRKTAERFRALGPDRCILTKLDEAVTTGPIAGLCDRIGLPLSFVTVGQEVPDDLEPARIDRLARCVLDGPDAIVRRENKENG